MDCSFPNAEVVALGTEMRRSGLAEYVPTNREKKLAPKLGKFWCWGCDSQLVGAGERCNNCGTKQEPRKLKK